MHYYHVRVASQAYRRDDALTYSFDKRLAKNTLVAVPMQSKTIIGLIQQEVNKPDFATRPVKSVLNDQTVPSIFIDFINWLKTYYPASYGSILLASLPSSLLNKAKKTDVKPAKKDKRLKALPPLTGEQREAIKTIKSSPKKSFLLHGETGSGKTRLYLECAKEALNRGESVLVMTPEIGLTSQLVKVFKETFGASSVVTFHSMLTPAERRDSWLSILRQKEPLIIVGARSAMFVPVKRLGLVVMDEAHEAAYKQEQVPYYQTSRLAAKLASLHGALFIMGTATPLVADYYAYEHKGLPIIRLSSLAIKDAKLPQIRTVRLNDRDQFKRSAYLSEPLIRAIETALGVQEQSLVYLNRRGSARVVLCQQCGWQATCPNCDSPLVYHSDEHTMRCHICGHTKAAPTSCPDCGHADITFRSVGTKTVAQDLARIFPEVRIQRFDRDNSKPERLEQAYESVASGAVDILVGTQVLGKGLDLPHLSVVGIAQADTSLLIPDYTADEITYQQLVQIIGRVGRGHRPGSVIIQSHDPKSPAIQAAIKRDYRIFYEEQLKQRQLFGFPPFYYLLKLTCHRANPKSAEEAATSLKSQLQSAKRSVQVIGPSPAFHAKKANQYYWQLIVKSKQRGHLLDIIADLPSGWSYDIDPVNLL